MKRKLTTISFGYAAGLFIASLNRGVNSYILIFSVLLLIVAVWKMSGLSFKYSAIMLIPMVLAFCIYGFFNNYIAGTALCYDGIYGHFSGKIIDIADYAQDTSRYILDGTINHTADAKIILYDTSFSSKIGDIISFDGTFEKISGDYLFDSESYYKPFNIFLSVSDAENLCIEPYDGFSLKNILFGYRDRMISDFRIKTGDKSGAFLAAMVFGVKSRLEDTSKTLLYRSGIGHIMAISGIHAAIISKFLMVIMRKLNIGKRVSFAVICVFLFLLVVTVGSPISVVRASVMLIILYGAELFRRENDTLTSLSAAALFICISNPFAIHSQGFLLSVSGTFGIGVAAPFFTKNIRNGFIKSVVSMMCVSFCVMPMSMLYFDEVSIISPVTNIFLIPICSGVLIIGLIYVLTGGLFDMLFIADYLIKAVTHITDFIGRNSAVYIKGGSETAAAVMLCILTAVMILRSSRAKYTAVIAGIALLLVSGSFQKSREYNTFRLTLLGRQKNTAAVVSYMGNNDVIDISGHYKTADYVKKYISQRRYSDINNVLLTKKQSAAYSAYCSALELEKIQNIMISDRLYCGNTSDKRVICYESGELEINYDCYTIEYSEGILILKLPQYSICIAENVPEQYSADIFICCGNKNKNEISGKNVIFTDEMNNFSLIFDRDLHLKEIADASD